MEAAIETFLNSVQKICPNITEDELALYASKLTIEEFQKKDYFLQFSQVQKSIGFIVNGLVRSYFIDKDGDEITVGFYAEDDYATHYSAFVEQQPSKYYIQCLEPTVMVCLSHENMQWVYDHIPNLERYGRLIAGEILKRQQERIESFIFQTAEERYLDFVKHHSGMFNRISISHLCSFLGIERQTLTRIRQKIAHQ